MWIHVGGEWRRGAIHCWWTHGGYWYAWMQHDQADRDHPQAVWGLYLYDGVSIRRRHYPAATASVEVPASWGPQRVIGTRLRDLGYAVALVKTGGCTDRVLLG